MPFVAPVVEHWLEREINSLSALTFQPVIRAYKTKHRLP